MTTCRAHAERRDRFLVVEGLEIHYSEWGEPEGEPVVCVHGFSRNGRAFDALARALAGKGYHILCPDVPGRGESEWSRNPEIDYQPYEPDGLPRYLEGFCEALCGDRNDPIRWVGTSMGGALGILLAGGSLRERIGHLVVNDIGPGPSGEGERSTGSDHIRQYRDPPTFRTLGELEAYFEERYGARDPSVDLRHLTITSARRTDDGSWTHGYDPAIVDAYLATDGPRDLWTAWDAVEAETLVIRGMETQILPEPELDEMRSRRPEIDVVQYPGIGHAPALESCEQIRAVTSFLS